MKDERKTKKQLTQELVELRQEIAELKTTEAERERAEEALKKISTRFQLALRSANIGLWDNDLRSGEFYLSPEWKSQLGIESKDIQDPGGEWKNRLHPEERERAVAEWAAYLAGGRPDYITESRLRHEDGSYRWFLSRGEALKDEHGQLVRMLGCHVDITDRVYAEQALRENKESLEMAQRIAHIGSWEWGIETDKVIWSDEMYRTFGVDPNKVHEELTSDAAFQMIHPDDVERVRKNNQQSMEEGKLIPIEFRIVRPDGTVRTVHCEGDLTFDKNGKPIKMLGTVQDVTERVLAEQALHESEERYRALVEQSPETIVVHIGGKIAYINPEGLKLLGVASPEEVIGKPILDFIHPESREITKSRLQQIESAGEKRIKVQEKLVKTNGQVLNIEVSSKPITFQGKPARQVILSDITERKHAEEQIKVALAEKEILLKEIHHRVKNNLATISGLLDLQASRIQDERVTHVFRESQRRIKSMGLVHEMLYQSPTLAQVDFAGYIQQLARHLFSTYYVNLEAVKLMVEVQDVALAINTAIPCGLIINELISNSLKHAFPGSRTGEVCVELRPEGDKYLLLVGDSGVGLPEDLDWRNTDSLGLQLVNILTGQLEGEIELDRSDGIRFKITFPIPGVQP